MSNSNYRTRPAARHARSESREAIALALGPQQEPTTTTQLWVVEAYMADGDKAYLDDWCIVHAGTSYEEARDIALEYDSHGYCDTNGNPCPATRLDLCDPKDSWMLQSHLEYEAEMKARSILAEAREAYIDHMAW